MAAALRVLACVMAVLAATASADDFPVRLFVFRFAPLCRLSLGCDEIVMPFPNSAQFQYASFLADLVAVPAGQRRTADGRRPCC